MQRGMSDCSFLKDFDVESMQLALEDEDADFEGMKFSKAGLAALLTTSVIMITDAGTKGTNVKSVNANISLWSAAWDFFKEIGFYDNVVHYDMLPVILSMMFGLLSSVAVVFIYYVQIKHLKASQRNAFLPVSLLPNKNCNRKATGKEISSVSFIGNNQRLKNQYQSLLQRKSTNNLVLM